VNWQHLTAFLWLRWRLSVNHWRRGGAFNAVVMTVATFGALALAVPLFIGSFVFGMYAIPKAAPVHLMLAWDGLIVAFLFCWSIGLLTELQRTESLSLSKFLHLPVSVNAAFLINYVSSLLSLTLIVFVPMMVGFCLALVASLGWLLVVALPSLAALLLMVTALTYQFQGWLASLMTNPRRRRLVIVGVTAIFVLMLQLPNLVNIVRPWGLQQSERSAKFMKDFAELNRATKAGEISPEEHLRRQQELLKQHELGTQQDERESVDRWSRTARIANLVLPIGWLPLGVAAAAEGIVVPALLGCLGMTLVGAASLWRAYRTTIRLYQGEFTARKSRPAAAPTTARKPGGLLLEARLPGFSEPVSAIALGSLQSLLRAPEAKMMFLTLVVMGVIFGSMLLRMPKEVVPELFRPLVAVGGLIFVLFGMLQLMANQFGFDRDGFRVFVLCAAPRRDILLGKNLAFTPFVLGMDAIILTVAQIVCPMRLEHFLAMLPQCVSMFLLFCILANLLSIYAPMHIAAGSMKPAHPKLIPILIQMVMFMFVFPLSQAPTVLPLAVEAALEWKGWSAGLPICLLLSLAECAAIVGMYRWFLAWEGGLLQAREQRILESLTGK